MVKLFPLKKFLGSGEVRKPVVISTWKHGLAANDGAWKVYHQTEQR